MIACLSFAGTFLSDGGLIPDLLFAAILGFTLGLCAAGACLVHEYGLTEVHANIGEVVARIRTIQEEIESVLPRERLDRGQFVPQEYEAAERIAKKLKPDIAALKQMWDRRERFIARESAWIWVSGALLVVSAGTSLFVLASRVAW